MKILWFTNSPSGARYHLTGKQTIAGGWIESLEKTLWEFDEIELAIAFHWRDAKAVEKFSLEHATYYKIPNYSQNKFYRYWSRRSGSLEPDTVVDHFEEVIRDYQPDVVHIFGTESAFGLVIPRIEIPTAIWIQGNLTTYTYKWFSGIPRHEVVKHTRFANKLKHNSFLDHYRRAVNVAKRERKIFQACSFFTGRTDWDRRLTKVLSPEATYFHCDEVLRPEFYSATWSRKDNRDKLILLTTIRQNLYKGLETIIETMQKLPQLIDKKVEWRLAGIKATDELVGLLKKIYRVDPEELGIVFMGPISSTNLIEQIVEADIFVHPSHIDNSPNSVCEAMLVGIPIIATHTGGTSSLLTDGEEGLLIQDGDSWSLAGSILDMVEHPDTAARMGLQARGRAIKRHDPQKIAQDLLQIYRSMLETRDKDLGEIVSSTV